MSVVFRSPAGWFLDARALIDQSYSSCTRLSEQQASLVRCSFKRQYFQTKTSHICEKKCDTFYPENTANATSKQAKKVRPIILEGALPLVDSARACGHLNAAEDVPGEDSASFPECGLSALCEMAKHLPLVDPEGPDAGAQALDGGSTSDLDLCSRVTENRSDSALVATLMGQEYVIPARSAFLLSDFTALRPLVQYGAKFDLVVIDPPWENKSVKRSRRYSSLPSSQLKKLPLHLWASPGCLVVTWVTNRPSHLRFVRDELYPHWGAKVEAEWLWVKVATSGQFVFPLDSAHKKPYEVMVLGRFSSSPEKSQGCSGPVPLSIEDHRLVVSVPSSLHSQKPCLSEVLKPYLGPDPNCLELFARNLHPGWTSWGNEVLKFQRTSYFTLTPVEVRAD